MNIEITLRKWQEEAVKRSIKNPVHGIFLEALGGRGKTICALSICKAKSVDKVIIVNNRIAILDGWKKTVQKFGFDKNFEVICLTDRALQNRIKTQKIACDVLIIDEWQNVSSDKNVRAYAKIKRNYTIGLSATPIRKKGQNFYPLEKTLWGFANPNLSLIHI